MDKINIILLLIIVLLLAYIIINNLDLDKQEDFATDIEAVANVASLYNSDNFQVSSMKVSKNLNVSGDINLQGRIFTNGRTNLPNGWGGGLRVFDVYGDGTLGWGDENLNMSSYINRSEASFPKLIVGGQNIIDNFNSINNQLSAIKEDINNIKNNMVGQGTKYTLQNADSNKCLYGRNEKDTAVYNCSGEPVQKWVLNFAG